MSNKFLNLNDIKDFCDNGIPQSLYEKINNLILKRICVDHHGNYYFQLNTEDIEEMTEEKFSKIICYHWLLLIGDKLSSDWNVEKKETSVKNTYFLYVSMK